MYGLTQTTAPTEQPVSLPEAKRHLRIDGTDSDEYIDDLIARATRFVEQETFRQLCTATFRMRLSAFPPGRERLLLPKAPLISVTSVAYIDTDGATQTFDSGSYIVHSDREPGYIQLHPDYAWPTTESRDDAVTVIYQAGYGGAADVPDTFKHAILLLVGFWHEHAEDASQMLLRKIPIGVQRLLQTESIGDEFIRYDSADRTNYAGLEEWP